MKIIDGGTRNMNQVGRRPCATSPPKIVRFIMMVNTTSHMKIPIASMKCEIAWWPSCNPAIGTMIGDTMPISQLPLALSTGCGSVKSRDTSSSESTNINAVDSHQRISANTAE